MNRKNPHAVALGRKGGRMGKLTEREVLEIRASNDPAKELAARYEVSIVTIFNIQKKRTWKWLKASA